MEVDRQRVEIQQATLASSATCSLRTSVATSACHFFVAAELAAVAAGRPVAVPGRPVKARAA